MMSDSIKLSSLLIGRALMKCHREGAAFDPVRHLLANGQHRRTGLLNGLLNEAYAGPAWGSS